MWWLLSFFFLFFSNFFCIWVVSLRVYFDTVSILTLSGPPLIRFSVGEMLNVNRDANGQITVIASFGSSGERLCCATFAASTSGIVTIYVQ